jgi:hypothetical protein
MPPTLGLPVGLPVGLHGHSRWGGLRLAGIVYAAESGGATKRSRSGCFRQPGAGLRLQGQVPAGR